ncbi:MAG: hypothetical protein ACFE8B_01640 [Candidatus Hermodarchaeota archaeon]
MEHRKVVKFLKIISYIFISISYVEISFLLAFNFIEFNYLEIDPILLSDFIYGSTYISLTGTVLWIFLIIATICFLVLGLYIFKTIRSNKIASRSLAKLMVVIGMVVLIGALVKMNFLVLLGKINVSTIYGSMPFQTTLYDFDITSITPAVFWIYFISVNCALMIAGLVVTGIGIKWSLLIENPEA